MSAHLDAPPRDDPDRAREANANCAREANFNCARKANADAGESRVRPLRPAERRDAFALLGRAFQDDPVATHLFTKPATRAQRWSRLSMLAAANMGRSALPLTSAGHEGTALWQTPRASNVNAVQRLAIAARFIALSRSGIARANRLNGLTSPHHPPGPHYYLAALGTEPALRRQGIGSALVRAGLEAADRDHLPAYLESSKASNVPFYRKHGFEVVAELEIEDGLVVWPMIRPAR